MFTAIFQAIDAKIVTFFQWAVRQAELYTKATKDSIIAFSLISIEYLLVALAFFTAVSAVFFSDAASALTYLNLIDFIGFSFIYLDLRKINQKKSNEALISKEVEDRKLERIFTLFVLLVAAPIIYSLLPYAFSFGLLPITGKNILEEMMSFTTIGILVFYFSFEYLICTTSLPPGEKEKKKLEKEMKNFVPEQV